VQLAGAVVGVGQQDGRPVQGLVHALNDDEDSCAAAVEKDRNHLVDGVLVEQLDALHERAERGGHLHRRRLWWLRHPEFVRMVISCRALAGSYFYAVHDIASCICLAKPCYEVCWVFIELGSNSIICLTSLLYTCRDSNGMGLSASSPRSC
jgi:hypothetical protein